MSEKRTLTRGYLYTGTEFEVGNEVVVKLIGVEKVSEGRALSILSDLGVCQRFVPYVHRLYLTVELI